MCGCERVIVNEWFCERMVVYNCACERVVVNDPLQSID